MGVGVCASVLHVANWWKLLFVFPVMPNELYWFV